MVNQVIIGIAIGVIATFGGRYLIIYVERRKHRRRLRKAFYEEIKSMGDGVNYAARILRPIQPSASSVPIPADVFISTAYEQNIEQIGVLSDDEVEGLTEFYSQCIIVRRLIHELLSKNELEPGDVQQLRASILSLQGDMVDAIDYLEENLNVESEDRLNYRRYDITAEPANELPTREAVVSNTPEDE